MKEEMKRVNLYVPIKYINAARFLEKKTGVTFSEMVRRGLKAYLLAERDRIAAKPQGENA